MRSRISISAVLTILALIAAGCGAAPTPAFVVSSTPVPGYGGTPLATSAATAAAMNADATSTARAASVTTSAAVPNTGSTATSMAPAATQPPSSGGAYGGGGYGGGGYGGGYGKGGGAVATQPPASGGAAGAGAGAQIGLANNPRLGSIVVDGSGRTLYILTKDTPNTSTCYDGCSQVWPPLLATNGSPNATAGVSGSMIGTALRTDGTTQVTYNGWPLYYFSGDQAPGDTNGQGIQSVWFAVSPSGNPVK